MHIPTHYYTYEVEIGNYRPGPATEVRALVEVPDWVVEDHDAYSDEHRVYAEHDEDGHGIGRWDYDDSYREEDDPFDIWLNQWVKEHYGPNATVESFSLMD
jgi:hypothetical protein